MKKITILACLFFTLTTIAQNTKRPDNWFNLDSEKDNVNGVSFERFRLAVFLHKYFAFPIFSFYNIIHNFSI